MVLVALGSGSAVVTQDSFGQLEGLCWYLNALHKTHEIFLGPCGLDNGADGAL